MAQIVENRVLGALTSLSDVVRWGLAQTPPAIVADVIVQDEFCHDVIVPWRDRYLIFDTT